LNSGPTILPFELLQSEPRWLFDILNYCYDSFLDRKEGKKEGRKEGRKGKGCISMISQ
jgi:hypothetical protein